MSDMISMIDGGVLDFETSTAVINALKVSAVLILLWLIYEAIGSLFKKKKDEEL